MTEAKGFSATKACPGPGGNPKYQGDTGHSSGGTETHHPPSLGWHAGAAPAAVQQDGVHSGRGSVLPQCLFPETCFLRDRQTDRQTHTHTHTHTHRVKVWFVKKPDAPEMKLWGPIAYEGPSTLKGQQAAFLTAEQPPWWHSLLKREKAGQEGPPKSLLCGNITSGPSLLPVASSATETRVDSLMEKWPVL